MEQGKLLIQERDQLTLDGRWRAGGVFGHRDPRVLYKKRWRGGVLIQYKKMLKEYTSQPQIDWPWKQARDNDSGSEQKIG
jgi:hypothetical protein